MTAKTESTPSKLDQMKTAMRARNGIGIVELTELTGWQPHTIRASISRLRKKGFSIELTQLKSGERRYRLRGCRS